jgi:ankyrin repeat protein
VYIAAQNGHADVLASLLAANANPSAARTDLGITPAYIAARQRIDNGQTPVYAAAHNRHADVLTLLPIHPLQ